MQLAPGAVAAGFGEALHRVHARTPAKADTGPVSAHAQVFARKVLQKRIEPPPMVATLALPPLGLAMVALCSHRF